MYSSNFGDKIDYYKEDNMQTRSSNIAELVAKNGFEEFDPKGITSYLTFRYPIGALTMFKDYKKVPFGCETLNGGKEVTRWFPKFQSKGIKIEDAMKTIEEMLVESIKKLVEGKRKIAVTISGGVDSSMILALLRKVIPDREIFTYSAGFYGEDEFEYARLVAEKFKSVHKEKILKPEDYIGDDSLLRPLIRHKGEPLHPNEIALAAVERIAKEDGCDIVLCGEGGDDIFGGYGQNLRMYMNYKNDKPFFEFFLGNYRYFSLEDHRQLIKDEYLVSDIEILNSVLKQEEMPEDIKDKVFYFIQKVHTPGLITRGNNAMSFNGFPSGFPYIDMRLVDFVNSLPFDYKVHWKSEQHQKESEGMFFRDISEKMDVPKYILKKLAEKHLPYKIIYRPKYGFPVPFEKWFKGINSWQLDQDVFKTEDISSLNGWKKFMVINLDTFIREFEKYKL